MPVVFPCIEKPRRGYYHATMKLAAADTSQLAEGELTRNYVRYLEGVIRRNPDMWLWSHRRRQHALEEEYSSLCVATEGSALPPPPSIFRRLSTKGGNREIK